MITLELLQRNAVIGTSLVATVALTAAFGALSNLLDLQFVDALSDPSATRAAIAALTPEQRIEHAWITATLDVAYPFAYACLFAGIALRAFPRAGRYLAVLLLLAIPIDLGEGVAQVLALVGLADWLALKAVLTPAKFALFLAGMLLALLAGLRVLAGALRSG